MTGAVGVRGAAASASRSAASVRARITRAPRLAALAARSTGSGVAVELAVAGSRQR